MSDGNDPLAGLTNEQMARLTKVVSESIDYQQRLRLKSCATPFIERTEDARLDLLRIGLDVLRRAGHPDFPEPTPTDPHATALREADAAGYARGRDSVEAKINAAIRLIERQMGMCAPDTCQRRFLNSLITALVG